MGNAVEYAQGIFYQIFIPHGTGIGIKNRAGVIDNYLASVSGYCGVCIRMQYSYFHTNIIDKT
jgi:hypothetical protein